MYSNRPNVSEQEYIHEIITNAFTSIIKLDNAIKCNTVQPEHSAHASILLILILLGASPKNL